jgi:AraC-like DNA-binding protein/ligand-binding sensor protein
MKFEYDKTALNKILFDVSALTGVSVSMLDGDLTRLAGGGDNLDFCSVLQREAKFKVLCESCDKHILEKCKSSGKFESHICHAVLYDFAMPIAKEGTVVGYLIMGRIRSESSPQKSKYSFDGCDELYLSLPYLNVSQLEALRHLMPHILFDSAIKIASDTSEDIMVRYFENNFDKDISVKDICRKFHVSKTTLYGIFAKRFGMGVSEYRIFLRINYSKKLLTDTDESVYIIAERAGVGNYTYFCKLFKKHVGVTPTEYRKNFMQKKFPVR